MPSGGGGACLLEGNCAGGVRGEGDRGLLSPIGMCRDSVLPRDGCGGGVGGEGLKCVE